MHHFSSYLIFSSISLSWKYDDNAMEMKKTMMKMQIVQMMKMEQIMTTIESTSTMEKKEMMEMMEVMQMMKNLMMFLLSVRCNEFA